MIAELSRIDEAQFDANVRFGGDSKRAPRFLTLADLLIGWPRHDVIHVADILKALPERRDDPKLAKWLSEPDVATAVAGYQHLMS